MRSNISASNALYRLTAGIILLAVALSKTDKMPLTRFIFITIGALKTAEGILRYCPVKAYRHDHQHKHHSQPDDIINPS